MAKNEKKEILLLTIAFRPNIGGIETHFDDLIKALTKRDWRIWVLTYQPVETKERGKWIERGRRFTIFRLPIIRGFFYKLVDKPLLEFLYLAPGLFLATPTFLLFKGSRIGVIHAQGLIAGFAGVFWGKIFGKKVVVSTHSIYHFPKAGFYRSFASWIFRNADFSMGLSKQARAEILSLGIPKEKVGVFTYWVDQKLFAPMDKKKAKEKIGWEGKFVVLFIGRLIKVKGIRELLSAAKIMDKKITIAIAGDGPLAKKIEQASEERENIFFLGKIPNQELPFYYNAADLLIVPSTHEEGFGRVILEALSCGTPVIGARRGAIPEAMDETVGRLIQITPKNIAKIIENLYQHPEVLTGLAENARRYAEKRFSEKNADLIIKSYYG